MSPRPMPQVAQLGFNSLLEEADATNRTRLLAKETGHLPGTFDEALPFYRALIDRHHAAMLAGDAEAAMALREEAHRLAEKLNHHEPGILAGPDAPGCALDRATRAVKGAVPLWGQSGSFEITHATMRVRITMDGIFGICARHTSWPGFAAHAVALDRPFLSETGFRSFLGLYGDLVPGQTPDAFGLAAVAEYVRLECKGKLRTIKPEFRSRKKRAAS